MLDSMWGDIVNAVRGFTLGDFFDILMVSFILYSLFRLIKDSKAYQMAIGLGMVLLLFVITQWGKLYVSHRIIDSFITYLIIAVIILFQGELRRFLTTLGSQSFRKRLAAPTFVEEYDDLFQAVNYLSAHKIGALIAFENEVSLQSYADRGIKIDAVFSKDLLVSLFFPHSPLHDGAVIVREHKIAAAGCLLPLPASHKLGPHFQTRTRHLAAMGLSQETDAVVVVVSEETGTLSLAFQGNLERGLDKEQLKTRLKEHLK